MLSLIKDIFTTQEDTDKVIMGLAAKSSTSVHSWSYIKEQSVYENTTNGTRVYPHEISKRIA